MKRGVIVVSRHTALHVVMVPFKIVKGRQALVSGRGEFLGTYFPVTVLVKEFKDSLDHMVCLFLVFNFVLCKQR